MSDWDPAVVARLGELLVDGDLADPGVELLAHLWQHCDALVAWLTARHEPPTRDSSWERAPARFLRRQLVRALHQRNQFLHIDDAASAELDAGYRESLRELARVLAAGGDQTTTTRELRAVLAELAERAAGFAQARLGAEANQVVCGEYSATLQLGVLGLASLAVPLAEPILDVGCGASAQLVRALRAQGKDAHGLDRDAPADVATVGDWLSFDFGERRWGSILSHLGFSLHFQHLHLAHSPRAFDHAKVYMAILRALRPGGRFAYAPGLPFIESLLPSESYRVEHVRLPAELVTPALQTVQAATGMTLDQATHVHRLV